MRVISAMLLGLTGAGALTLLLWGFSRPRFRIGVSASLLSGLSAVIMIVAVLFTHPTSEVLTSISALLMYAAVAKEVQRADEEKRADKEFRDRMDRQLPR